MVAEWLSSLHTQPRYDAPAFHLMFVLPTQEIQMNDSQLNRLLDEYATAHYSTYIPRIKTEVIEAIKWGIQNGYLAEVERKNLYTFGGVSISLTDTELATVISYLVDKKKISAIKTLRCDVSYREISLKEAKDFADHLGNVVNKVQLPS
jgi:ribosomal protein L7/L12